MTRGTLPGAGMSAGQQSSGAAEAWSVRGASWRQTAMDCDGWLRRVWWRQSACNME